jgi:acetyltransferase-like isoleucine patch superfamily enzyme
VTKPLELDGFVQARLARTTEDGYCRAAREVRHNEFWWYYNGLVPYPGFWKPFQDRRGRWWYHVKPGFAWPVDYFSPIRDHDEVAPGRLLLGWQCPVPEEQADSQVWLNVIHDLSGYDISRVVSNKRRAVRKGFHHLAIEVVDPADVALSREACVVWNSHVERTGWNKPMDERRFVNSWRELSRWPGTTVMTARDPGRGRELCAWLIARVIDDTVFIDTIASHTDRLTNRPNDTIIFACLASAAAMGIHHAHYSLKSKLKTLEAFKESLGFVAHPFASRLKLHWPIGPILRIARPGIYMRLHGDPVWSESDARRRSLVAAGLPRAPSAEEIVERLRHPPAPTARSGREERLAGLDGSEQSRQEIADLARSWYVPAGPPAKTGWLVYSLDFVLATLQSSITEPQKVRRTAGWLIIGTLVRALMAVAQALLMLLAKIPVVSWFMETLVRTFTRNAAGFFLRSCYWKARLKRLGIDTLIDQGVEIWGPKNVSIGSNCHIDTNVRLAAGERRHRQRGSIVIGNCVHLGPGVHIAGRGGVEIRDYVGIMANAHLYSATGVVERPGDPGQLISMSHSAPHDQQHIVEGPIQIDHYAFIGMMTRIMPGVKVGFGAVVHGNCELTRDVPPFANIGAVPRGRQIGWRRPRRRSPRLNHDPGARPQAQAPPAGADEQGG